MNTIWQFILTMVQVDQVGVLTALLVGNFFTGVLAALFVGKFDWSQLKDIWKRAGIIYGAYLVVASLSTTLVMLGWGDTWEVTRTAMCVYLSAFLVNKMLENLAQMGFPISSLQDLLSKVPGLKLMSRSTVEKKEEV